MNPQYEFSSYYIHVSYYGETNRHLKVRSGEHIKIFPLIFKNVKLSVENSIGDQLLLYSHYPSVSPAAPPFDDFIVLVQTTNMFLGEIKESLLIKHDKPILNKNISFAPLFSFEKV